MPGGTPMFVPVTPLQVQGGLPTVKIAFVVAAAALTTAPAFTPAKAQGVKIAQVDKQGRHLDDRGPSSYYAERRQRSDSNNPTVCVGPVGVSVGPRQDLR